MRVKNTSDVADPAYIAMSKPVQLEVHSSRAVRWSYTALGLLSTSLGILGAFLPVLPTTCFMLLAIWAFSKSSPRLHNWLRDHKILGASIRRWQDHRSIPVSAKIAAILSMSGSFTYLVLFTSLGYRGLTAAGAFIAVGAFFVLRAPSLPTGRPEDCVHPEAAAQAMAKASRGTCPVSITQHEH